MEPRQGQYNNRGGQVDDGKKQNPNVGDDVTYKRPYAVKFHVMPRERCKHENVTSSEKYKR